MKVRADDDKALASSHPAFQFLGDDGVVHDAAEKVFPGFADGDADDSCLFHWSR